MTQQANRRIGTACVWATPQRFLQFNRHRQASEGQKDMVGASKALIQERVLECKFGSDAVGCKLDGNSISAQEKMLPTKSPCMK